MEVENGSKYHLNKERLKLPSNISILPLAIVTRVYFELTKLLANLVPSHEHPIGSPVSSKGSLARGLLWVGLVWRDATRSGKYSLVDEWADIYLIVLKTHALKFEPVCSRPIVCNPSSPWSRLKPNERNKNMV